MDGKPVQQNTLQQRLLQDLAELQSNPYPNIALHFEDDDITKACLILTVEGYGPMHLTVLFHGNYPLSPPEIQMNSQIRHPNIYSTYICASILNTTEGYTPAYTLKGIAIQLLSFFGSDTIEQDYGNEHVKLDSYRNMQSYIHGPTYICPVCHFGTSSYSPSRMIDGCSIPDSGMATSPLPPASMPENEMEIFWPALGSLKQGESSTRRNRRRRLPILENMNANKTKESASTQSAMDIRKVRLPTTINNLPPEVLLIICNMLDTEDLWKFTDAWRKIGLVLHQYDIIRTRELICFCLKKDYMEASLGVGVRVLQRGKFGSFESEFDLLSTVAFHTHHIRRSVQGIPFDYWMPLPISNGHWKKVKKDVLPKLAEMAKDANLGQVQPALVLFHFMNDVVVNLQQKASKHQRSSLTHASEKAIESYFHLFHLLVCLASEDPRIVQEADNALLNFVRGHTSKDACPNLGHLLVAALISSVEMTEGILKTIIKETITRNVVWMLDAKGANMAELSYMEPNARCNYRLKRTFEASITSYRLLMFLNLFRRVAVGTPRKPLKQLRDEAFERHGAPPKGEAKGLADSIKRIHRIDNFPDFLRELKIGMVSPEWFTSFLRDCIRDSISKRYHQMPISQAEALYLRRQKEPAVQVLEGLSPKAMSIDRVSFFPRQTYGRGNQRGGARGGRGRGARFALMP
jgi:ubiquitin-protein ligase